MKRAFAGTAAWILLVLLGAFASASCTSPEAENRSGWVKREDGKPNAIVFVHGFLGDATGTWTAGEGAARVYWPELIADDESFRDANVYVLEYPTSLDATLTVSELAQNMRTRLKADGVLDHERLFFVAHSMGGLVTRKFVLDNPDLESKVGWLFFFGTPSQGSQVAALLKAFSGNAQIRQLVPATSENVLGDLTRDWIRREFKFPSYCSYEKRKTNGVMIVEFTSAASLCTKALEPIDADHSNIVKPRGRDAISYLAVKNAYDDARSEEAFAEAQPDAVYELRLDYRGVKRNASELARAVAILRKEYGNAPIDVEDFEFVDLAERGSKDDLVAVFDIKGKSPDTRFMSVFAAKDGGHENILNESIYEFPHVFLVRSQSGTYLLTASYGGSRGFMSVSAYRRLRAGHFKALKTDFEAHYNKRMGKLVDGLYLFSGQERYRMVFKGDSVTLRGQSVAAKDFGSTTHELRYVDEVLTYDGKPVDTSKPIQIGPTERILVRHDDRVLLTSEALTWGQSPAGTVLKPVKAGEGTVWFPEANVEVRIRVR